MLAAVVLDQLEALLLSPVGAAALLDQQRLLVGAVVAAQPLLVQPVLAPAMDVDVLDQSEALLLLFALVGQLVGVGMDAEQLVLDVAVLEQLEAMAAAAAAVAPTLNEPVHPQLLSQTLPTRHPQRRIVRQQTIPPH